MKNVASLLKTLFRSTSPKAAVRKAPVPVYRARLSVEGLENRLVPAQIMGPALVNPAALPPSGPAVIQILNQPQALYHLEMSCPGAATAGSPFAVTITLKDAQGHIVDANGTQVTLTSLENGQLVQHTLTFSHGVATAHLTFTQAGLVKFGASAGTLKVTAQTVISPAAADHFDFILSGGCGLAGSPMDVTIIAKDKFGNTVTGYNGPITLTATNGQTLNLPPGPINMVNGQVTVVGVTVGGPLQFQFVASDGTIQGTSGWVMY